VILRLDPAFTPVWRNPYDLQLGVDPALRVLRDVTDAQQRMLAALQNGVPRSALSVLGESAAPGRVRTMGAHESSVDDFLAQIAPALMPTVAPDPLPTVAVTGVGGVSGVIAAQVAHAGFPVVVSPDAAGLAAYHPALAIVCSDHVVSPQAHLAWLSRDIPHLSVVMGDAAATIGPIVDPGRGACLFCVHLTRRDLDAAWPAIATQLLTRRPPSIPPVLLADVAAFVAWVVSLRLAPSARARPSSPRPASAPSGPLAPGTSVRIDALTGARRSTRWAAHPECGCRGIPVFEDREPAPQPPVSAGPR